MSRARRVLISTHWLIVGIALALGGLTAPPASVQAATSAGIAITPAQLTLRLPTGMSSVVASFSLTNQYNTPVSIHLAIQSSDANVASAHSVTANLTLSQADITLNAGQTVTEAVTLTDSSNLPPGSQIANLLVAQATPASSRVTIGGALQLPVVTIKEAGAVARLGGARLRVPGFGWSLPTTVTTSLRNTGNVLTLPRGFVTITAPNGRLMSKGVLDDAASAISPGSSTVIAAKLAAIHTARWPGVYTVTLTYGLGGGQSGAVLIRHVVYIAWWHVLVGVPAVIGLWYAVRYLLKTLQPATIVQTVMARTKKVAA